MTVTIFVLLSTAIAAVIAVVYLSITIQSMRDKTREVRANFKSQFKQRERLTKEVEKLTQDVERLKQEVPEAKKSLERQANGKVKEYIETIKSQFQEDNIRTISQAVATNSARNLQEHMKATIERTYSKMSQEFLGNIGDETDKFLVDLKENLCDKVWDSMQQIISTREESPIVLPEGTKMGYSKGNRTVIVIENKPQIRSVTFTDTLLTAAEKTHAERTPTGNYRFGLAFPYVYFFIVFDNNSYRFHEVYFRNKALTSAREHVYQAPLPNVWRGNRREKAMCMGEGFDPTQEGTLARQSEHVVSEFWQRSFNEHLGNGGKIDKRIRNYVEWQQRTEEDPLFILKMKWGKGTTALNCINRMLKGRSMKHPADALDKGTGTRRLLEQGTQNVIKSIKDGIDLAKKNHTLRSGEIDELAKETLTKVVTEHSEKVFANCAKV